MLVKILVLFRHGLVLLSNEKFGVRVYWVYTVVPRWSMVNETVLVKTT